MERPSSTSDVAMVVVLRTRESSPAFDQRVFTRHCTDFLRALATITGTRLHAHRFRPDRVELLLGPPPSGSLDRYLLRWRSLCAREWYRRGRRSPLWDKALELHPVTSALEVRRLRRQMQGRTSGEV